MYYKVLAEKGKPHHGGRGEWPLPRGKRPGAWLEVKGDLRPCRNGLHLCRKADVIHWLGPTIYTAEADESEIVTDMNKIVVRRARLLHKLDTWNDTTARLFAADCAKDAVRRCRKAGIEIDPRVDERIRIVYRFARGEASAKELAASRAASWAAAEDALRGPLCGAALRAALWAASRDALRGPLCGAASRDALRAALWAASRDAAEAWQTKRLFEYLDGKRS